MQKRTCAQRSIVLVCCYMIICQKKTTAEAYAPFFGLNPPPAPFRDAAFSVCPYTITIIDVLQGMEKAISCGHFNYESFDPVEYDNMDLLQNGDCTWIVPGKLMAFSGPQNYKKEISPGVFTMSIDEYGPLFKKYGVTGIVRFNKKLYDRQALIRKGLNHYDMYYEDGSNPSEAIAQKFLKICEVREGLQHAFYLLAPISLLDASGPLFHHLLLSFSYRCLTILGLSLSFPPRPSLQDEKGAVAVHCKAGLGRTGTNIGNYMMKHYGYTT